MVDMDQPGHPAPRPAPPPDDPAQPAPRPDRERSTDPDEGFDDPADNTPMPPPPRFDAIDAAERKKPANAGGARAPADPSLPPGPTTPSPLLPSAPPRQPPPMGSGEYLPSPTASTWYRTDQQRYRSVYRRANPWYRRLARGFVGLALLAVVGAGVFVGITALNDYLERDKLPGPAADPVAFRSTAFLVSSSAPAPEIDGTLTIDTTTQAFQFVGGVAGPQANTEVVSPDGTRVYVRVGGGPWRQAQPGDAVVADLGLVIPHLLAVVDSDDVLLTNLRNGGYIDLVEKSELGPDDNAIDRYEMLLDTAEFATDYPLQWADFRDSVVPSMIEGPAVPLTMSIDSSDGVVGIDDDETHWSWQRLNYAGTSFTPLDPSTGSLAVTEPASTDG